MLISPAQRSWEVLATGVADGLSLSGKTRERLLMRIHDLIDSVRKESAHAITSAWESKLEEAERKAKLPTREHLPDERQSITKRFEVAKTDGALMRVYATVGLYSDGRPGELFIHADKVGTTAHGALDAAAMAVSVGLQYGIPLKVYTEKLKGTRFGPEYPKFGDEKRPRGASILALVAQWLEEKFLPPPPKESTR